MKKEQSTPKAKKKRGRPKKGEIVAPKEPTILEQQQHMKGVSEMLTLIPTACDVGTKRNAKGYKSSWIGGKLHIGAVDGEREAYPEWVVQYPAVCRQKGKMGDLHVKL